MYFKVSFFPLVRNLKMKIFQLTLLCFICSAKNYGQIGSKNHYGRIEVEFTKEKRAKKIDIKVEIRSTFPGGDSAWVKSIEKSINEAMGVSKRVKKGKYIVAVKFIITKDGSLVEVQCENDPGFGMCQAAIRAVKKSKNWTPVPAEGRTVNEFRH